MYRNTKSENCPIPTPALPLKGRESGSSPFKGESVARGDTEEDGGVMPRVRQIMRDATLVFFHKLIIVINEIKHQQSVVRTMVSMKHPKDNRIHSDFDYAPNCLGVA